MVQWHTWQGEIRNVAIFQWVTVDVDQTRGGRRLRFDVFGIRPAAGSSSINLPPGSTGGACIGRRGDSATKALEVPRRTDKAKGRAGYVFNRGSGCQHACR